MESLRVFSNLSSVEVIGGESGTSSSNSVKRPGVVGIHMLKNRAQGIRCTAVATERRTVPVPIGSRSDDDRSLFNVLDRMRNSGPSGSVFDFGSKVVDKEEDVSGRLDQWVKESVHEILNSLDEAPFLMQIYSVGEEGGVASTKSSRLVKVKAGPNSWPLFRDRWNGGSSSNSPNGVILVGEIDTGESESSDEVDCGGDIRVLNSSGRRTPTPTKVWGLLIQGKGGNYPACYVLKTSKVKGLAGVCCTHFCLARVECFVEHVDILFKKLWLL